MNIKHILKNVLTSALFTVCAGGLIMAFSTLSEAKDDTAMTAPKNSETPAASDEGVLAYGQTLYPARFTFKDSDYTWKDLKSLMPDILPDAETAKLSANDACDHIVKMTNLYLNDVDRASNYLGFKLGTVSPGIEDTDLLLSQKLTSRSPKALNDLLLSLPDDQSRIIVAKEATLKSLALILLHDAALANCPDHAKAKEYNPITTYSEPPAPEPAPSQPAPAAAPAEKSVPEKK